MRSFFVWRLGEGRGGGGVRCCELERWGEREKGKKIESEKRLRWH